MSTLNLFVSLSKMSFTVEQEIVDDIIIKVIKVYESIVVINSLVKAAKLQYAKFI